MPLSRTHRGPVVYLTSRVLYEMNRTSEERVTYVTADAFDAQSLPAHLARIAPRVLLENLLLDRQLARANPMTARTRVLGTEVARRTTVQAAIRLETAVREARRRPQPQAPFVQRLLLAIPRARRAADDEDAYLALVCPPLTGCARPA